MYLVLLIRHKNKFEQRSVFSALDIPVLLKLLSLAVGL